MDSFCPLQVDLKGRDCLVVGGGSVALRKLKIVLTCRARVTVVSPKLDPEVATLLESEIITYFADIYRPAYLKNRFIVISATSNAAVNRKVAQDCRERGILVNAVSDPGSSTFAFPAVMKKGLLTVTVSTAGSSPALARRIRDELAGRFGPEYAEYTAFLNRFRPLILERAADPVERKDLLEYMASSEFFSLFTTLGRAAAESCLEKIISGLSGSQGSPTGGGRQRTN